MTIHEGKKRQIRRMFKEINHPVLKLTRIKFGGLSLGDLKSGGYRFLTAEEIEKMKREFAADRRTDGSR